MRLLALVVLVGCYSPHDFHCEVSCGLEGGKKLCPEDLECGTDSMCHDKGKAECTSGMRCAGANDPPPFRQVCVPDGVAIMPTRVLPAAINTDTDCDFIVPDLCVIAGDLVTVASTVRVRGSAPLGLLGIRAIAINATLDLAGRAGDVAPGAVLPPGARDCAAPNGNNSTMTAFGAGGGAGGGYQGVGGDGGDGENGLITGGLGGAMHPAVLRGGCNGGNGGNALTMLGGLGGHGGGAVYLLTNGDVSIGGVVNASGGGAGIAMPNGGGGGGGSGGVILVSANRLLLAPPAQVFALGGGGSSGGPDSGETSKPGNDPKGPTMPAGIAVVTNNAAGPGGGGSDMAIVHGKPGGTTPTATAGGGGGGASGYIIVRGEITAQPFQIVPLPTP